MKTIKNLSESDFLKLFFMYLCGAFLIGAACMPDRGDMLLGLWRIWSQPGKISTNDFALGGFSATFLNMGLVALTFLVLLEVTGAQANNVTTLGFVLTVGFGSWGITVLNIIPTVLGVALYCVVKKERFASNYNAMLFSTGIAPLITDLFVRYPNAEVVGFNAVGIVLALVIGIAIGFFLPAGLSHSPNVHKGFDLYSAAVPICFMAFFLNATLYKTLGISLPAVNSDLTVGSQMIVNIFCGTLFVICILFALAMGCKVKDYVNFITAKEHVSSVSGKFGTGVMLMNVGVFGLFILAYYNVIGASFNAVTFGIIFCMLCTCNSGSHPGNVTPIVLGYVLASLLAKYVSGLVGGDFTLAINAQAIIVGLCYANGMSPIVSKYGWFWGVIAGMMHYGLVTSVPNMHGGYCLYNGGFTAGIICLLLVPQLERFVKPKN